MGYCYLLHFHTPIAPGRHTCQHYLGYTARRLRLRISEHRNGRGARLTQVAIERGISFTCVRTWPNGSRSLERKLKNQKNSFSLCPICRGEPIKCKVR